MSWPEDLERLVEPHPADGTAPADIDTVGGWDSLWPEPDPEDGDGSEYGEDTLDGPGTTDPLVVDDDVRSREERDL